MARNGSGIYTLPPVYAAVPNTVIQATQHNTPMLDIQAALTNSIAADGQTPMTGNLKMGSKKITDLSPGTAATDAVRYDQVSDVINTAAYDFPSRAALVAAKAAGYMVDGNTVYVDGIPAIIDSTQTGTLSALNDLGVNGVRLNSGNVVTARWWTEGMTTDASVMLNAAATYAAAHRGTGTIKLVYDENLNLANSVVLGGDGPTSVDTSRAVFTIIAGGNLAATGDISAITVRGVDSVHYLGTILCGHICGGWAYLDCTNSRVIGARAEQFRWRGHRAIDGCPGMTLEQPSGYQYGSIEQNTAGFVVSQFDADGIYLDTNDVRVLNAHIGYCRYPIRLAPGGTANEIMHCHPFNGVPGAGIIAPRSDTIDIYNEVSSARVFVEDCYIDNGYVVDTTGTLFLNNCFFTDLNTTQTQPYIRISADAAPNALRRGSIANATVGVGYYTGAYSSTFASPADFTQGVSNQALYGSRINATGRVTNLLPATGNPTASDVVWTKQGNATTSITTKFTPGTGADVSLTVVNGEAWLARPVSPGRLYVGPTSDKSGIGSNVSDLRFFVNSVQTHIIQTAGHMLPGVDNTQNLGSGAFRYATVFAGTGAINTSDEREKQDISGLSDAERKVAVRVRGLIKKFRFKDAVAAKGGGRWHFGVIAQDVIAAFAAEGLDAMEYGAVCHDAWDASEAVFNEEGVLMREAVEAGDRYGVRYDELAFFIIGAMA